MCSLVLRATARAKDVKVLIQKSVARGERRAAVISETGDGHPELVDADKRVDALTRRESG
jgi:hypothetical protein